MNLAELKKIINSVETFGFKDEEVVVRFTTGRVDLDLKNAKACVIASEANALPILTTVFHIKDNGNK